MFNPRHFALFGHSIYMLLLVALVILFSEQMGERSGGKLSRKIILRAILIGAAGILALNSVLFFDIRWALYILRFDLLFFVLVPPFCFGLWEKSAR